jgi:hypothetical protein
MWAFSEKPKSRNYTLKLFTMSAGIANSSGTLTVGNGAQFWVYLSPQNDTSKMIQKWKVTFSQGDWNATISSDNPTEQIHTPGLSGIFNIQVELWSGSTNSWRQIPPQAGSYNEIGCNSNCASMVGIVADSTNPMPGAINAHFWTTWDAFCSRG